MSVQIADNCSLDEASDKPLVTFALFAYNQEHYIREAVEGAFSQTYEPLEIIFSDDCSTDRTFEIMQEMVATYHGRHSILLRRNGTNLGLASHVNTVLKKSEGEIIVVAAGDDVSLPDRTEVSVDIFNRNPGVTAVLLSGDVVDQRGDVVGEHVICGRTMRERSQNIDDLLAWRHVTFGASRAIRREVFTTFGPLREDCPTEDTPLLLRSLMCGSNIISPHKGIFYRRHENNLSSAASMARMNVGAIYDQYRDDFEKAKELDLLNLQVKERVDRWSLNDRKAREVRLKIAIGEKINFNDYVFVLRHPSFSLMDKLRLTAKCILPLKDGAQ